MKKILALLLSLMLLLPAIALGEAASNPDVYAVEFDDFTITMNATDALQKGEKANGQVLFMLYPDYDETATMHPTMHPNINGVWTSEDVSDMGNVTPTDFGNLVLQQSVQGLAAQGVAVSNEALLAAERDEETGSMTLIMSYDADYTAVGLDLKVTLYMMQLYVPLGGDTGSYIFTLTGSSMEDVDALLNKLDAIEFKE